MDISYFLSVLWNRKWLILTVLIVAGIATYFLVGMLPPKYKTNAIISTGIIEFKGVNVDKENPFVQKFQVENAFSNLIESISGRTTLQILTKRLVKHDLSQGHNTRAFRQIDNEQYAFDAGVLSILMDSLQLENKTPIEIVNNQLNPELNHLLKKVAEALEYDYETLREDLKIQRIGETDYLNIEFTSENPELTYYTVDHFSKDVVALDRSNQSSEESTAFNFYKALVEEKKRELDTLNKDLNSYKKSNKVVNLEEQTKSIVSQIRELEIIRARYQKEIPSLRQNIRELDEHIRRTARINADEYSNTIFLNSDVEKLGEQIRILTDQYITGGSENAGLKAKIDRLKNKRKDLIDRMASNALIDSDDNKESNRKLLEKRIDKQLELATAEESVKSLNNAINKLENTSTGLVSNEAYLSNLEQQLKIVEKEYFDVVDKLHQVEQVSKKEVSRLAIIEPALKPEKAEDSNKLLLSLFAGISSAILAILAIFIAAFLDLNPTTPKRYLSLTKLPVLGTVPFLKKKFMNFSAIFNRSNTDPTIINFLESLRKIRYKIETSGKKSLLITSAKKEEGKSFITLALAHSLALTNRRILIIDGNFKSNLLSSIATMPISESPFYLETNPVKLVAKQSQVKDLGSWLSELPENIDIIGNPGGNLSPTEALGNTDLKIGLEALKQLYDYIIIEGGAMNEFADAREIAMYTEGIINVACANRPLTEKDQESLTFLRECKEQYIGTILNQLNEKI